MKILGFETASGRCSVCISSNIEILATELLFENSMQAENLTHMIDRALAKAKLDLKDIDFIATTNGPGSFTGIRIGLAAALGLANSSNLEAVICSNFEIINYRIREQYRNFDKAFSLIDAFRGEIYLQSFDKNSNQISSPSLLNIEKIREEIRKESANIVCAGSGAIHFSDLASSNITILPRFPYPDARIVCKLARTKILKEDYSNIIEPLYIRKPDAKLPQNTL